MAASLLGRLPAVRQRLVDQLTEIDLAYPGSPLTHSGGGQRAPDIALTGGGRLHEVLARGFAVLSVGAPSVTLPPDLDGLARAVVAEVSEGYQAGQVYLIRPDAYVMAVGEGGAVAALEEV